MNITSELISRMIDRHTQEASRGKYLYELYKGHHAIKNKTATDENKPNNKLINNYFSLITDSLVGFFLGKPVAINHKTSDKIQESLNRIFTNNNKDDLFSEIAKECSIKGKSYLMVYQNENKETLMIRVPAEQMIVQKDMYGNILFAIHYFTVYDVFNDEDKGYAEVFTPETVTTYQADGKDYSKIKEVPHIFGQVPIVLFQNDEEEDGDIAKVESLVNAYDFVMSIVQDTQEYMGRSYLAIRNMILNDEVEKRLMSDGIIELGEGGDVFFIKKEIQTDVIYSQLETLSNNIHKFAHVPDFTNEKSFGNVSGVALKTKLKGMEDKIRTKSLKFKKSINQLLSLLAVPIQVETNEMMEIQDFDIVFTPNIPVNETEEIDNAIKLSSIISLESSLSRLPFVDDPMGEIEKRKVEQQDNTPVVSVVPDVAPSSNADRQNEESDTEQDI